MVMFVGDPVLLKQTGSSAEGLKCKWGSDHYPAWSPSVAQGEAQGRWETAESLKNMSFYILIFIFSLLHNWSQILTKS